MHLFLPWLAQVQFLSVLIIKFEFQLDVYLNGIGTWKNRNIIACLTVCNGEYDTLLPWPCTLKADIVLKDQPNDIKEV